MIRLRFARPLPGSYSASLRAKDGMARSIGSTYAIALAVAALCALAAQRNPFVTESLVGAEGATAIALSLALGVIVVGVAIGSTRVLLRQARWARTLRDELRPTIRGASGPALLSMALASGLTEEIFFRGLLVPFVGVALASLVFGAMHAFRGRWAWAAWAAAMGAVFAVVFVVSGSLLGAIAAHVAINAANLRAIRDAH